MSKYQSRQFGKRAFTPIIKEEMVSNSKDFLAKIEREARIEGLMMARYVTAKNSREEKAIDVLIKSQELEKEEYENKSISNQQKSAN